MSKERELLKECRLMLDNPINGTAGRNLQIRITEHLSQPEQRLTPLTSKLISLGNNCHESFIKGIRFAEKMHGIRHWRS